MRGDLLSTLWPFQSNAVSLPAMTVTAKEQPSRRDVWKMFDRIAPRYDLLNRLLSLGIDAAWRKRMIRCLPAREEMKLLDLATGTADQAITLVRGCNRIESAVGLDMAEKMIEIGREKIARLGLAEIISLATGDAGNIPKPENFCDTVTISFGIRNVVDVPKSLREMLRVLRPGGRALILEFSTPPGRAFKAVYLFYLRHILPNLGAMISGDSSAYRYLNQTIETFPSGESFCVLMRDAGFSDVKRMPLSFGIATIYQGDKPVVVSASEPVQPAIAAQTESAP